MPERGPDGRFLPTQPNQHPNYLVKQARSLGIAPETILSFTTEQLGDLVSDCQNQLLQERQWRSQEQARIESAPEESPLIDPKLEEQLIPEMATYLKGRHQEMDSLKKELKDAINEQKALTQRLLQAEQQRQVESNLSRWDALLGKHKDVIGDGRCVEQTPGTRGYLRRLAIMQAAQSMPGGATQENVDKVRANLFGDAGALSDGAVPLPAGESRQPASPLQERLDQWNGAGLSRPTSRNGAREPKEDPKARATRGVAQVLASWDRASTEANGSLAEDDFPA